MPNAGLFGGLRHGFGLIEFLLRRAMLPEVGQTERAVTSRKRSFQTFDIIQIRRHDLAPQL
jgi:hypothetical protein